MSDDAELWRARWREGRTAWHVEGGSPTLRESLPRLDLGPGKRVLVPLAGKSHDLFLLASTGAQVVGVELVEEGAAAFFAEHQLTPERRTGAAGPTLAAGNVEMVIGDFLAQRPETLGRFDAIYDRAALVALPPARRADYVRVVRALAAPGARLLVATFEHDDAGGPPYSLDVDALRALYPDVSFEPLTDRDVFDPAGGYAQRGATFARETHQLGLL